MEEISVDSWDEFETTLEGFRPPDQPVQPLLFRGQENSCWPLTTTLERRNWKGMRFIDYYRLINRIRPEIESFTGKQWPIPGYEDVEQSVKEYDSFSLDLSFGRFPAYPYMAYLRHHGFPSPLLDWTRSPYVAAHYAFRGAADGDNDKKVSIYVLSEEAFSVRGNELPLIFRLGPRVRTHRRHFLQQSEYTVCVIFENNVWRFALYEEVFACPNLHQGVFRKFTIPSAERLKVLKQLDRYNLNAFSLFGSQDSLLETMALRELDFQGEPCPSHG